MLWKLFNKNKVNDKNTNLDKLFDRSHPMTTRSINVLWDQKKYTCNDLIGTHVYDMMKHYNCGLKTMKHIKETWIKAGHKVSEGIEVFEW